MRKFDFTPSAADWTFDFLTVYFSDVFKFSFVWYNVILTAVCDYGTRLKLLKCFLSLLVDDDAAGLLIAVALDEFTVQRRIITWSR